MRIEIIFNEETRWAAVNNMVDPVPYECGEEEYEEYAKRKHEKYRTFLGPVFENVRQFFFEHGFFTVKVEGGAVYSYNTNTINRIRFGDRQDQ